MCAACLLPSSASRSSTSPGGGWLASVKAGSLFSASSWRLAVVSLTDWSRRQRGAGPACVTAGRQLGGWARRYASAGK
jgi:hypothetical protein